MKHLLIALCILFAACYGRKPEPEKTGMEGKILPSFTVLLADSTTTLNTQSIPQGKPFVIFVFGAQCPYSKAQMQTILDNMDQLKELNLYILMVAPFMEMKEFIEKYNLSNYSNIIIGIDQKNIYAQYMNLQGVPYTSIYDKNKKLKNSFVGETSPHLIKELAEEE